MGRGAALSGRLFSFFYRPLFLARNRPLKKHWTLSHGSPVARRVLCICLLTKYFCVMACVCIRRLVETGERITSELAGTSRTFHASAPWKDVKTTFTHTHRWTHRWTHTHAHTLQDKNVLIKYAKNDMLRMFYPVKLAEKDLNEKDQHLIIS